MWAACRLGPAAGSAGLLRGAAGRTPLKQRQYYGAAWHRAAALGVVTYGAPWQASVGLGEEPPWAAAPRQLLTAAGHLRQLWAGCHCSQQLMAPARWQQLLKALDCEGQGQAGAYKSASNCSFNS